MMTRTSPLLCVRGGPWLASMPVPPLRVPPALDLTTHTTLCPAAPPGLASSAKGLLGWPLHASVPYSNSCVAGPWDRETLAPLSSGATASTALASWGRGVSACTGRLPAGGAVQVSAGRQAPANHMLCALHTPKPRPGMPPKTPWLLWWAGLCLGALHRRPPSLGGRAWLGARRQMSFNSM